MTRKPKEAGVALVVEGGGMRGIFPAGVLDVFHEQRYDPFNIYLGVSAGACNLSSFIAGQYLRNHRIYTTIMTRPEFISINKFLRGGHYMDLDFLWKEINREVPLDIPAIIRRNIDFTIVATSAESGTPIYLNPTAENCLQCLKASSSVPLLYRRFLTIEGRTLTDGGVADPIPVYEAYRRGARKIVVIRTRPHGYCKSYGLEARLTTLAFRRWPGLRQAVRRQAEVYRNCLDFIQNPPAGVSIAHIAPDEALRTGRTTQDSSCLHADYMMGKEMGVRFLNKWG